MPVQTTSIDHVCFAFLLIRIRVQIVLRPGEVNQVKSRLNLPELAGLR